MARPFERRVCATCGYRFRVWECECCDSKPTNCVDCHDCEQPYRAPAKPDQQRLGTADRSYQGSMFYRGEW